MTCIRCRILDNVANNFYGGGVYVYTGTFFMQNSVLGGNMATNTDLVASTGHAIHVSPGATAELDGVTVIPGSTVVANYPSGILILVAGTVNYGTCPGGTTPGEHGQHVYLSGGNFTGCPFLCPRSTYGPGGESTYLQRLPICT